MSVRKALTALSLIGVIAAATACSDVTAPQTTHVCPVVGNGQTCVE